MRILLPSTLLVSCLFTGAAGPALAAPDRGSCPVVLPAHVRVFDCQLAAAVAGALAQSATLQQEFARIAELQGIVYVATGTHVTPARRGLVGALSHQVGVSGSTCVLRITLKRDAGRRALGTVAHELRHAIEVLEHPEARSEFAIDALFARIGYQVGYGVFETEAAGAVQQAVLRELRHIGTTRRARKAP